VRSAAALTGLLAAIWLLASGHTSPLLLAFGALSCLLVVVLSVRMGIVDEEALPVRMVPRAIVYTPWLVKEVLLANLDVARRILSRKPVVSPRIVRVKPSQKSDLGRVLYANSITLTPGTVSIMVDAHAITVHALSREAAEALEQGEMDRRVTWLEGEG
jgi:multicomponent Na+:H+ antiporter subunit E